MKTLIIFITSVSFISCNSKSGSKVFSIAFQDSKNEKLISVKPPEKNDQGNNWGGGINIGNGPGPSPGPNLIYGSPALNGDNCDGSYWGFNDPFAPYQWQLCNSGQTIPGLSSKGDIGEDGRFMYALQNYDGQGIIYKFTDSGVETNHDDLKEGYVAGKDFCKGAQGPHDSLPTPKSSHGTQVAGIISAQSNNGIGIAGIASKSSFMADNLISECNQGDTGAKFIKALNLPELDIWVGTFSNPCESGWITNDVTTAAYNTITEGTKKYGISYVKAIGNNRHLCNTTGNAEPLNTHPAVITVASIDHKGKSSSFSTRGPNLHVSGYGGSGKGNHQGICTTTTNNDFSCGMHGSSAATAMVAGVLGLLKQANPELNPYDYGSILIRSARESKDADYIKNDAGYKHSNSTGFGIVNADEAIKLALDYKKSLEMPQTFSTDHNNRVLPAMKTNEVNLKFSQKHCATQTISVNKHFQIYSMTIGLDIYVTTDLRDLEVNVITPKGIEFPLIEKSAKSYSKIDKNGNPVDVNFNLGQIVNFSHRFLSKQFFGGDLYGKWQIKACGAPGIFVRSQLDAKGWGNFPIPVK